MCVCEREWERILEGGRKRKRMQKIQRAKNNPLEKCFPLTFTPFSCAILFSFPLSLSSILIFLPSLLFLSFFLLSLSFPYHNLLYFFLLPPLPPFPPLISIVFAFFLTPGWVHTPAHCSRKECKGGGGRARARGSGRGSGG